MRRLAVLISLIGLLLAGCSSGEGGETAVSSAPDTGPTTSTVSKDVATTQPPSDAPTSTPAADATTTTDSGRPVAPDFTLELGEGGSYTLSEGAKPVFMVFWAEW